MARKQAQIDFATEVFPKELKEISSRRAQLGLDASDLKGSPAAELGLVGLALSGGGIRSATFSLGVVQALARRGFFGTVDYLSTVSGGGYLGSCLSSMLNNKEPAQSSEPADFPLRKEPGAPEPPALAHLRNSSNYLSPGGLLDKLRIPTLMARGVLLNMWLFLPYIGIAVYLTKLAFYFDAFGYKPAWKAFVVLGGIFLLLAGTFPFVSRVFRAKFHWELRNRYELLLTFAMGLAIAVVAVVPALVAVDWFLLRSWSDISGKKFTWELWVLGPILVILLLIVVTASNTLSRFGGKFVLYVAGFLGPLALFSFYLLLCVKYVDTPYLTSNLLEDIELAATSETNLQFLGERASRLPREIRRKLHLGESEGKITYCFSDSKAKCPGPDGTWTITLTLPAEKGRPTTWRIPESAKHPPAGVSTWTIRKEPKRPDRLLFGDSLDLYPLDERHEWLFPLILLFVWLVNRSFLDVNITSPHSFYRDRLSRAYLIRQDSRAPTGVAWNDDLKLSSLNREGAAAPYHLINAAVNLEGSQAPDLRGRNADAFIFSKCFTGGKRTGYCRTRDLEAVDGHLDLGTAMAISAAAASPNMGSTTITPLRFILTILNIRLGYWLPNPARIPARRWKIGLAGPAYLLRESVGRIDEKGPHINVSDGGHFENLGIYELLRRHCKLLVAVDAEEDGALSCGSLIKLMRYASIDMGIEIKIDFSAIQRKEANYAVGTIDYGKGEIGNLVYVKAAVLQDGSPTESPYIINYAENNESFPHESTGDQFFDETQFEAYRALGDHIASGLPDNVLGLA